MAAYEIRCTVTYDSGRVSIFPLVDGPFEHEFEQEWLFSPAARESRGIAEVRIASDRKESR